MTARILIGLALATGCMPTTQQLARGVVPVGGRVHVRITADDGSVNVVGADLAQVEMTVTAAGYARDDLELGMTPSGGVVDIVAKIRHHVLRSRTYLQVDVRVPRDAEVEIRSGDGAVSATAIAGGLEITTGDGAVDVRRAWGRIALHSGDGSIDGHELDGAVSATSGDGSIELDGRFDRLAVQSGDGELRASARPGSRVLAPWGLNTGDGSVALVLPRGLAAHVDVATHDGSLRTTFPLDRRDASHAAGDLNGGGPPIVVRTGDGSIRLDAI